MRNKHCPGALILVLTAILVCTPALAEAAIRLPAELTVIEAEAFRASGAGSFVLPEGVQQIGSRAFAEVDVRQINLPSSLTAIADDAFDEEPGIIVVEPGSFAWDWCVSRGWQTTQCVSPGRTEVNLGAGEHKMFKFTASDAGNYRFYSEGELDTVAILYDADMSVLAEDDDGGDGLNFRFARTLSAGEQLFLEVYFSDETLSGSFPLCIDCSLPINATYRALIIGNVYDNSPDIATLTGCDGDRIIMANLLDSMTGTHYSVRGLRNLTASRILSAIPAAFSGADDNSVSLFYFSGHGFSDTGELVGTDGEGVSYAALRKALDAVPGKKIVILDCCYSGNAIGKGLEEEALSDGELDAINRRIIRAFASPVSKSGELAASDYYVLTAASKEQLSWGNSMYGFFTYCLAYGSGWDGYENVRLNMLFSDDNDDGIVSLQEAYIWTEAMLDNFRNEKVQQHAQVYPEGSDFVLWAR